MAIFNCESIILSQNIQGTFRIINICLRPIINQHIFVSVLNSLPQFFAVIETFIWGSSVVFESFHTIGYPGINILLNFFISELIKLLKVKYSVERLSSQKLVRYFGISMLASCSHLHLRVFTDINMQKF